MTTALGERALREILARLEESTIRTREPLEIADSVSRAWALIADPERALGRAARSELPESSGLTLPMVAWALSATFANAGASEQREAVARMYGSARPAPAGLSVLILAGNVFTACVQPWSLALLARAPLLVKASSKDDLLPRLFHAALAEVDPPLADACAIVTFPGGTPELEATLLSRADVVSAYGSDATLTAIRQRLAPTTTFIPHGNGLGVGFVPRAALSSDARALEAAKAFALDVAAYDQRGCLSPHAIWVERGGAIDALTFARILSDALGRQDEALPRGSLPTAIGAAQLQWRGVALARGELFEGDGWAVSYEGEGPLRLSPGYRNVLVLDASGLDAFAGATQALGVHLKCVGVAGDRATREAVAAALLPPLAPRICAAGRMQRPSLLSLADGRPPWEGLFRRIELE